MDRLSANTRVSSRPAPGTRPAHTEHLRHQVALLDPLTSLSGVFTMGYRLQADGQAVLDSLEIGLGLRRPASVADGNLVERTELLSFASLWIV